MQTWVIGDIQGHYDELNELINKLALTGDDQLWFVGDLVNRGPKSLETLRFIYSLGSQATVILGNHDLSLITTHYGHRKPKPNSDTLPILNAPDRDELIDWLGSKPLVHHDANLNACMIHAGLYHQWTLSEALALNAEYQAVMSDENMRSTFLSVMFGNEPNQWNENLEHLDRLRFFVNACTRMRCINHNGALDFSYTGSIANIPTELTPWFTALPASHLENTSLYFGHWAALKGQCPTPNIVSTDTACCWGGALSATCIQTGERIEAPQHRAHDSNLNLAPTQMKTESRT